MVSLHVLMRCAFGAGDSTNIAYLANVCVSEAARRCHVGEALIQHARQLAESWGKAPEPAEAITCSANGVQ